MWQRATSQVVPWMAKSLRKTGKSEKMLKSNHLFCSQSTTDKSLHSRSQLFQYRKWDINQLRAVLSDAPTLNDIINREQIIPFLAATNYKEFSQIASRYLNEENKVFETTIPLSSDVRLRKLYENPFGLLRLSRVLEDLDAVSALAALYHVGREDVNCVTAAVDGVRLHNQPWSPAYDLIYHSKVTYTGKTSMNISLTVEQKMPTDGTKLIMEADFVYVARNLEGTQSIPVPPLRARNEEEKASFERAALKQLLRKERAKRNLTVSVPTIDEQVHLHQMFKRGVRPEEEIYMSQVTVGSTHFMLPDERNMYGFTFGGVLMRRAYELAFVNNYLAFQQRPIAVEVGDISFIKSVPVGSILELHSSVVYTKDTYQVVLVDAMVNNLMHDPPTKERTNTFNFVLKTGKPVKKIFPISYEESMKYISGRRMLDDVLARI
ncbi:acyl-Coenzyme A thioesterase, mitochondrial precursor [Galdieria sulphuraria]|uniref:Acyl-Coenzyme A thioesterase, mitochondrial n=1 Tax=Galdieria sulphuraria TaxID=130081 RepID=M2XSD8_GALSU|nr:acyl-Coenzyme A thioesterase, mitochondrial precursor [Galdieria sulphuraria]EME26588.1 acyl-Coenzyme A thioesterase, mitochondrial precursor [Galdieria sulphuraria]|eukprot:XP_005703108.1 acyl-Coenzyme A thioesterase, mitochondrial precursor [Galdieria sulphuraria]